MAGAPPGCGPFGDDVTLTGVAPPTGAAGCRYLNPATKSYQIDPTTGQLAQMPPLRQRVVIALTTLRGSSTVLPELGVRFPRKMGTTFPAEGRAAVRDALRQMTDVERVMRIDAIEVEHGAAGRGRFTVSYTDLTTGEADTATA